MSYVYFIRAERSRLIKIGIAIKPRERLRDLQIGSAEKLTLLAVVPGDIETERALHTTFAESRSHGEWFHPHRELLSLIKRFEIEKPPEVTAALNATGYAQRRFGRRVKQQRADLLERIRDLADERGLTPEEWVWNIGLPLVVRQLREERPTAPLPLDVPAGDAAEATAPTCSAP